MASSVAHWKINYRRVSIDVYIKEKVAFSRTGKKTFLIYSVYCAPHFRNFTSVAVLCYQPHDVKIRTQANYLLSQLNDCSILLDNILFDKIWYTWCDWWEYFHRICTLFITAHKAVKAWLTIFLSILCKAFTTSPVNRHNSQKVVGRGGRWRLEQNSTLTWISPSLWTVTVRRYAQFDVDN